MVMSLFRKTAINSTVPLILRSWRQDALIIAGACCNCWPAVLPGGGCKTTVEGSHETPSSYRVALPASREADKGSPCQRAALSPSYMIPYCILALSATNNVLL